MIYLREIFTTGVIASIVRLSAAAINFILNIIIARLTELDVAGYYFLLITLISGWSLFAIFGLNIYTLRSISSLSEKHYKAKKIVFNSVYHAAFLSVFFSIILFFISYSIVNSHLFHNNLNFYLYTLSALSIIFFGLLTLNVFAIKAWGGAIYAIIFQNLLQPIVFILLIVFFSTILNLLELIIFYLASIFSAYIISLYFIKKNYTHSIKVSFSNLFSGKLKLLKRSMPLIPLAIFPFLMLWVDTFIVALLLSPEDVAVYNIAARISFILLFVLAGFEVIVAPKMNWHRVYQPHTFNTFFIQLSIMIFIIMLGLTAIMLLLSEPLLKAFGESYLQAEITLNVLIWAQLVKVLGFTSAYYMISVKKHNLLNVFQFNALAINAFLNVILIMRYGVEGAAYATLISSILLVISQVVMARQLMQNKELRV